jgi:hypothetical protein
MRKKLRPFRIMSPEKRCRRHRSRWSQGVDATLAHNLATGASRGTFDLGLQYRRKRLLCLGFRNVGIREKPLSEKRIPPSRDEKVRSEDNFRVPDRSE